MPRQADREPRSLPSSSIRSMPPPARPAGRTKPGWCSKPGPPGFPASFRRVKFCEEDSTTRPCRASLASAGRMADRILMIEDDERLAAMLAEYLAPAGLRVVACRDAGQGLARLRRESFDALVLDV